MLKNTYEELWKTYDPWACEWRYLGSVQINLFLENI